MAGQVWAQAAEGGYLYAPNLSNFLRMQVLPTVKFRQLNDVHEQDAEGNSLVGKNKGDRWRWNVFSKLKTKGGQLDETQKMPKSGFKITQTEGVITEYGNGVDYTGKLNDLSEQPLTDIIRKVLRLDVAEAMDVASHAQYNATPLRVAPTNGNSTTSITLTEDSSCAITNAVAFGTGHVRAVVATMKERNIPAYDGDDYLAIARPQTYIGLKGDLEGVNKYTDTGLTSIRNGEIGRYENMRFIEQTHIPAGGAKDSTTWDPQTETADPWNGGKSDWMFFMGADTVAEGICVPEELRGAIPTDFGRDHGIAWYALLGFGLSHPDAKNARVLKWESAV